MMFVSIILIFSCSSVSNKNNDLFQDAGDFIRSSIPDNSVLALYPVRVFKNIHELSDFLLEGLTAELSGSPSFSVVNRQALSVVLDEQSLQLSGLTDEATGIEIGKLIGADILLTGFIENRTLFLQLIDVQTSENIAGAQFPVPESYFDSINEKKIVKNEFIIQDKGVFEQVIVDDFNDAIQLVKISSSSYEWGDKYGDHYALTLANEGFIKTAFGSYIIDSALETEGGADFYININMDESDIKYNGYYLRFTPVNITTIEFGIGEQLIAHTVIPGISQEIFIPYKFFKDISSNTVTLYISADQNADFISNNLYSGEIQIEEAGYYRRKNETGSSILSFEDSINEVYFTAGIEGYKYYIDYMENDNGELKFNADITSFSFVPAIMQNGAVGSAVDFQVTLGGIKSGIKDFFENEQTLSLGINMHFFIPENRDSGNTIRFFLKSDDIRTVYSELYSAEGEFISYADAAISPVWSSAVMEIPAELPPGVYHFVLVAEIPPAKVISAATDAEYTFSISLDELQIVE